MIERHIDIETADGAMNALVVHPDEGGPHPVVLFYMDSFGLREELFDMTRRLASAGYFVVLPNLYYRRARQFEVQRDKEGMAKMFDMMAHLDNALVTRDTESMLAFADAQPAAREGLMGAVGYCMSGPFVIAAAARFPTRFGCIAAIHGAHLVTGHEDSAHRLAEGLRCETYVACAEIDKWSAPADVQQLERALAVSGAPFRIEWYPGAQHGFVFPQRAGMYDLASAERHWERLHALFARCLR